MRKLYLLFFFIGFIQVNSIQAQCPLTEAIDFTATDIHGNEHTLSDYLAEGKFVLIDFFFTT